MPTRHVVLTDHRLIEEREAAKLKALQTAALTGFTDLDHGRHRNVSADDLGVVIEDLGCRAGEQVRRADH